MSRLRLALLAALATAAAAPGAALGQAPAASTAAPPAATPTAPATGPLELGRETATMLVVDVSGSMDETDARDARKIDGAKSALLDFVGGVEAGTRMGLRTYPSADDTQNCNAGRLAIDVGPVDPDEMSANIRNLTPDGDTPTAEALRAAVDDLKATGATNGRLVLVSDGESTCEDPCETAREIRDEGFRTDTLVVGFQISDEGREELECIAGALGGKYVDAGEGDRLRETLDDLTRPDLQVEVDGGADRSVIGGGEPFVITGTVTNDGGAEARDVVVQLGFTLDGAPPAGGGSGSGAPGSSGGSGSGGSASGSGSGSRSGSGSGATGGPGGGAPGGTIPSEEEGVQPIDVPKPVVRVGNLAPGESREVRWRVRAAPGLVGRKLGLSVSGRSENSTDTGLVEGAVSVDGVQDVGEAGAILRGPGTGVALLGDGFASGEGAKGYSAATDGPGNGCHRSPRALLAAYGGKGVRNLACSGSILAEVTGPRRRSGEELQPAQTAALADSQRSAGPVQAAVVMAGASDAGMGTLLRGCAFGRTTCTEQVLVNAPYDQRSAVSTTRFLAERLGVDGGLRDRLIGTYRRIDEALNAGSVVDRRGRAAPLIVVGYPVPTPFSSRTCLPMGTFTQNGVTAYALSTAEMRLVAETTVRLNGVIEGAVETLRRTDDVPIAYVPAAEMSAQPRNTVCNRGRSGDAKEPYIRSVVALEGARINGGALDDLANPSGDPDPGGILTKLRALDAVGQRAIAEIGHPNPAGHDVQSLSLLRWSRTREAERVARATAAAGSRDGDVPSWSAGTTRLTGSGTASVERDTTYPLVVDGFAPRSRVRVSIADGRRLVADAQADGRGRVTATIPVERQVPTGAQELDVDGIGPDARPRVLRQGLDVQGPPSPPWLLVVLGISVLAVALGLVLRRRARRLGGPVDGEE